MPVSNAVHPLVQITHMFEGHQNETNFDEEHSEGAPDESHSSGSQSSKSVPSASVFLDPPGGPKDGNAGAGTFSDSGRRYPSDTLEKCEPKQPSDPDSVQPNQPAKRHEEEHIEKTPSVSSNGRNRRNSSRSRIPISPKSNANQTVVAKCGSDSKVVRLRRHTQNGEKEKPVEPTKQSLRCSNAIAEKENFSKNLPQGG